ncbi:hypothetical protein Bca52824_006331 [Brassica carinata]|uniref:Pentacotripeptide-repeat region of PRORP domain-containing protein n=1 Tax=Brassica carinata TaxID=52824 RepID=A0A8X7WSX3_BRACI|nr:hypothetical protein Bca52824_006331 [Brassica carinata]
MQALSIWPLKFGLLVGSRLEFELDCSCSVVSRKIRKRHSFVQQVCFGSISSLILDSSNTSKILFLCEPKRSLLRSSVGGRRFDTSCNRRDKTNARVNVRELAYSLRAAKTADDVDAVLKEKKELPLQVYCAMIRGFGKDKRLKPAMAVVDWLKRKKSESGGPNLFIYNSLLGAVKESNEFGETEKILRDMEEEGIVANIVTYNTLMAIYMEQGEFRKALEPSPVTYSTALLVYRRMEDGMGALEFFSELRERYSRKEIGNDNDHDWEFEFIKLENFVGRICYQVMRRWLVREDENLTTKVLKLLNEMDNAGVKPSKEEHERLIWACTRGEHHHVVGGELERAGCLSLQHLAGAASKRGIWRWGVKLLNKMEDKGIKPQSRHWNAVLVACSKASETAAAIQIFKAMVENGEKPTVISYGALLSALEKGKLYDEAFKVWNHMIKVGIEPNLHAYTIMAAGVEPSVVTYNAVISACARNGLSGEAYEWFGRMRGEKVEANEITYEVLIEALADDGKPRLAYELHLKAQSEGLKLSAKPYDAVVRAAESYGATIDVNLLGPRPEKEKRG